MHLRYHAAYMHWAKTRPTARFDLAISNVLGCSIDDLPGAADALSFAGRNDNGYEPLIGAIAKRYGVDASHVTTAQGASGANFLVYAALLSPGDDVLVERPGYDPLMAAPRLLGAHIKQFDRIFEEQFALDPGRVEAAITPKTKLIVVTTPHNPTGVIAAEERLREVGRIASAHDAHVLVDEVYLDSAPRSVRPAVHLGDRFIVTSSLTKSYGLAGLRCGWVLSSPEIAERIRRARDVVDGTGSIVAERLGVLAFEQLDALMTRTRTLLDRNRAIIEPFLQQREELEYVLPDGGTVVFPRLRGVQDTRLFAEGLLSERHTAVVPGGFFQAPSHIRVGFSGDTRTLEDGLQQLGAALDDRVWS
jgi:aspartate/methionine/tyrosine aminotransferase